MFTVFNFQLNTPSDSLGDVFTFLLTENLHRGVAIEAQSFKAANIDINLILRPLGDRLISHRLALRDRLERELGKQIDWEEVSGILAALAFLNQSNLEDLLDMYLKTRKVCSPHFIPTNCSNTLNEVFNHRQLQSV